jgi:hypothetical protein
MTNHNQTPSNKNKLRAVAAMSASALALAGSGISIGEASAAVRPQAKVAVRAEKAKKHETPFSVLTGIVASLDKGGQAKVAAKEIKIPGPINEAKGKPIVFKADGQTYFAYTQETEPNFNQKRPADVEGDMAIVKEPTVDDHMPLEYAHLDKIGELVNEDDALVGFSTGGDSTGKTA